MPLELAEILVALTYSYAIVGGLVGGLFVTLGLTRVDPAAAQASLGLRLLLWPLSAALWPWTLWRWLRGAPRSGEATAHKRALAAGRPR
jgi:hypothetical protein